MAPSSVPPCCTPHPPFLSPKGKQPPDCTPASKKRDREAQGRNRKETEKISEKEQSGEEQSPSLGCWGEKWAPWLRGATVTFLTNSFAKGSEQRVRAQKGLEESQKDATDSHPLCLETHVPPYLSILLLLRGGLRLMYFHNICYNVCQYVTNAMWIIMVSQCKLCVGIFHIFIIND